MNFDAALFKHTNSAGIGVIMRDWRGVALGALSTPTLLPSSVADMEALACLRAVQFVAELDLHCVIFEGDSAAIISAVSQGISLLSSFGNILDDVRCLIPSFSSVKFSHVNRSGNLVVDALAKKASSNVGCQVWMDAWPLDIDVWLTLMSTKYCFCSFNKVPGLRSGFSKKKKNKQYMLTRTYTIKAKLLLRIKLHTL